MTTTIVLYSPFETEVKVAARWQEVLEALMPENNGTMSELCYVNEEYGLEAVIKNFSNRLSALVLVVGSGGTERLALNAISLTNCPVVLVANNRVNSLAAAIEINAIAKKTRPFKFVYVDNQVIARKQIEVFLKAANSLVKINHSRFGVVSSASPWLISSDNLETFGNFKTELIPVSIESLVGKYRSIDSATKQKVGSMIINKSSRKDIEDNEVFEASGVYLAMKSIIEEEKLDGLTIKCFDLLQHKITACLGMAIANDKGVVASCEGDLHASFCMMLGMYLTGNTVWMANPSSVDINANTLTLAHCTVPFSMLEKTRKPNLDTHMESQLSVAIEGSLRSEEVTIFRTSSDFSGIYAVTGTIVDTNMGNKSFCRTQAVVKLNADVCEWMQNTPGNHQILAYGNTIPLLKDFCLVSGMQMISV